MKGETWPSDWLRAVLPLMSLGILTQGSAHGYALLHELNARGFTSLKGGTLYPLLARQEDLGHIAHTWELGPSGPARKVFELTEEGRREYLRLVEAWRRLNDVVESTSIASQTEQK